VVLVSSDVEEGSLDLVLVRCLFVTGHSVCCWMLDILTVGSAKDVIVLLLATLVTL